MAFDLRVVIGFLFAIMGAILVLASASVSGALASGVASTTVDASAGVAMLGFGTAMVFFGWRRK